MCPLNGLTVNHILCYKEYSNLNIIDLCQSNTNHEIRSTMMKTLVLMIVVLACGCTNERDKKIAEAREVDFVLSCSNEVRASYELWLASQSNVHNEIWVLIKHESYEGYECFRLRNSDGSRTYSLTPRHIDSDEKRAREAKYFLKRSDSNMFIPLPPLRWTDSCMGKK